MGEAQSILLPLCMGITTIFFGTLASQHLYKGTQLRATRGDSASNGGGERTEDRILGYLSTASGPVASAQLEEALNVSRSTVLRAMARLEKQRKVEWVGKNENDPNGGFKLRHG